MGLKQETAVEIENNLKNASSTFYIGKSFEHLLDFSTPEIGSETFNRITDDHNHYYGYWYSSLYLKEIINQWKNAGFDISNRPSILATLYNIGFKNSHPSANPLSGGAIINIDGQSYSFGSLAQQFYDSDELLEYFLR